MKKLTIMILFAVFFIACSDIEVVTDKEKSFSIIQHTNKIQVYDYDELVFETACAKRVKIDTYNNTTYVKVSNGSNIFDWTEVHQYELADHQYMFKKVRCE